MLAGRHNMYKRRRNIPLPRERRELSRASYTSYAWQEEFSAERCAMLRPTLEASCLPARRLIYESLFEERRARGARFSLLHDYANNIADAKTAIGDELSLRECQTCCTISRLEQWPRKLASSAGPCFSTFY